MPAALRLLTLVAILALARPVLAQDLVCQYDPSLVDFFNPTPPGPDGPNSLATACVGEPYSQIIKIWNPGEFTVQGVSLPLNAVSLPTSGGIDGLPFGLGLSYRCSPPNCFFPGPGSGGGGYHYCIEIFGTPTNANPPETYDLSFSFQFNTAFGLFPVDYPSGLEPDAHVYLKLEEAGKCPEPHATLSGVGVLGVLAALARRRNGCTGA